MNKNMEWLESQIKNANESAEKYAKEKRIWHSIYVSG